MCDRLDGKSKGGREYKKIIELYEAKKLTKSHKGKAWTWGSPEERGVVQKQSRLVMRQGLLYRKVKRPGVNVTCMQFVTATKI